MSIRSGFLRSLGYITRFSGLVGSGRLPGVRSRIVGRPSDVGKNDTASQLPLAVGPPTWLFAKVMVS